MSLILRKSLARNPAELRAMNAQYGELNAMRNAAETVGFGGVEQMLNIIGQNDPTFAANAARTPAEAYREFDQTTKIDQVPAGEHATLTRVMQQAKSVNIGRELFEYRRSSDADAGQTSMSGQTGVKLDQVDYSYAGTPVPIHDKGFGRTWREVEAMRAEGFDDLVDDSRESERKLMTTMDDYLWNGNAGIVVKGQSWLGLRNDPTVASATLGVDLAASASTATAIRDEVRRVRDILYITNNCAKPLKLVVSREIASNWERVFSTAEGIFGTIYDMILKLRGIDEIYEDSELTGNQIAMLYSDVTEGFHPVVGMGISTYALPRMKHNDDFNFVKWAAVGFLSRNDFAGRTCALYGA